MTPFLLALVFTTHFPSTTPAAMAVRANVVYAVANGTLYRSGDGGATFAAQSSGVGQIAVDPENAGIVYESLGTRVRRSMDGGATWTSIANGRRRDGSSPPRRTASS